MKRNKIKPIYLNQIKNTTNINKYTKIENTINNIETKLKKILIFIGLLFLLFFFSSICLIFLYIFNIDYNNLSQLKRVIYISICDIIFLLIIIFIYRKTLIKDFKNYFQHNFIHNISTTTKYWLIGLLFMAISNWIIIKIAGPGTSANEESVREYINLYPLYMFFQLSIYAPLTEELIFRKSIKDIINNKYIYVVASGLIFALMHIILNITNPKELLYIFTYASLGISFAALYNKTDNIFSSIAAHSIHNTITLILYLTAL